MAAAGVVPWYADIKTEKEEEVLPGSCDIEHDVQGSPLEVCLVKEEVKVEVASEKEDGINESWYSGTISEDVFSFWSSLIRGWDSLAEWESCRKCHSL
ncbi:uncharacterized protein [Periplaneta americana]|uniref:uncharacterized protein isoform X2 n=1 Tax=Periplaneta americana TaxID=6978 RepID=UPI0037E8E9CC